MLQTATTTPGEAADRGVLVCGNAPADAARIGGLLAADGIEVLAAGTVADAALRLAERPGLHLVIVLRDAIEDVAAALARGSALDEALAGWRAGVSGCLRLARRQRDACLVVDAAGAVPALSRALRRPLGGAGTVTAPPDAPPRAATDADPDADPGAAPALHALAALALMQDPEAMRLRAAAGALLQPPGRGEPDLVRLQRAVLRGERDLARLRDERAGFEAEARRHFREVARLTRALDDRARVLDDRARALEAERDAARAEAEELGRQAAFLRDETGRFYGSWSWKVTAPLRTVRRVTGL